MKKEEFIEGLKEQFGSASFKFRDIRAVFNETAATSIRHHIDRAIRLKLLVIAERLPSHNLYKLADHVLEAEKVCEDLNVAAGLFIPNIDGKSYDAVARFLGTVKYERYYLNEEVNPIGALLCRNLGIPYRDSSKLEKLPNNVVHLFKEMEV